MTNRQFILQYSSFEEAVDFFHLNRLFDCPYSNSWLEAVMNLDNLSVEIYLRNMNSWLNGIVLSDPFNGYYPQIYNKSVIQLTLVTAVDRFREKITAGTHELVREGSRFGKFRMLVIMDKRTRDIELCVTFYKNVPGQEIPVSSFSSDFKKEVKHG